MKTSLAILALTVILSFQGFSQPYPVSSRQITFNDPARGRNIATRVYHPGTLSGTDKPFASGSFPLIVIGHGFSMGYDAYLNFVDSLVPLGYIVALPTTEVGPFPFPNHENFALDLKFLNTHIKSLNTTSTSLFYQHVSAESAIMGHSMGGGCTFLACENNTDVTTLVTFAPAETNTSAITAALQVTIPALVFSGENDGVTPPDENHIPMYNNLASECKTLVNILGGGHCYYALDNWACDFGESTSNPQPTITRTQQQIVVFHLLIPYLDHLLKGNTASGALFLTRLQALSTITYQRDCITSVSLNTTSAEWLTPVPFSTSVFLPDHETNSCRLTITDATGRIVARQSVYSTQTDLSFLSPGLYLIEIDGPSGKKLYKALKE